MNQWILISIMIIGILALVAIILLLSFLKKKKEGTAKEPNYQVFFLLGVIWLPVGVVFMIAVNPGLGIAFIGMAVAYMAIGIANKDKWKDKG